MSSHVDQVQCTQSTCIELHVLLEVVRADCPRVVVGGVGEEAEVAEQCVQCAFSVRQAEFGCVNVRGV